MRWVRLCGREQGHIVTGVVFDFGNVLYRVDYESMARELAGERWSEFVATFVGSPWQTAYETGRADLEAVLRAVARHGFSTTRERFLEAYLGVFTPVAGMRDLVSALANSVPLGLLSNTSAEHARLFIEKTPEFRLFSAVAYSFEMGCMKPDPHAYREISRRLGLPPTALAYTDDVTAFAEAAERVGMRGIPFRNVADLAGELAAIGFRVHLPNRA